VNDFRQRRPYAKEAMALSEQSKLLTVSFLKRSPSRQPGRRRPALSRHRLFYKCCVLIASSPIIVPRSKAPWWHRLVRLTGAPRAIALASEVWGPRNGSLSPVTRRRLRIAWNRFRPLIQTQNPMNDPSCPRALTPASVPSRRIHPLRMAFSRPVQPRAALFLRCSWDYTPEYGEDRPHRPA
jgi:hypothetical protein